MAIRKMIAGFLEQLGSVEVAADGQEALAKVKSNFFDVIVSDIGMPVMDGMEFFKKAMEIDPDIGSHFVFCSGNISSQTISFFKQNNLVYMEKPFRLNQLLKAVQTVIDNGKQQIVFDQNTIKRGI